MNNENDDFKQIDRKVVTEATILDMELDMCHDPSENNELQEYYRHLLCKYDLFEKPFVEDASESDYHEYTEEDDFAVITCENEKYGLYDTFEDKYLLEPLYNELIEKEDYHHIITRTGNRFGFYDTEFNAAPRFEQYKIGRSLSFIRFMLNGKWGFMDKNGERTDKIEEARACIRNPMFYIR